MNRITFEGLDYAPVADFALLREAAAAAPEAHVGLIFSSDSFYPSRPELSARMVDEVSVGRNPEGRGIRLRVRRGSSG